MTYQFAHALRARIAWQIMEFYGCSASWDGCCLVTKGREAEGKGGFEFIALLYDGRKK